MLLKGLSWSRQKQAELDFKEQYNMVINRVKLIFGVFSSQTDKFL